MKNIEPYFIGKVSERTHKAMSNIKSKDTSIEVKLRRALWAKGIHYKKNYKRLPGKPDIVIMKYKIAVFCDSEFFHGRDWGDLRAQLLRGNNGEYWVKRISRNIERDKEVDDKLRYMGWTVIRFWGKDINKNVDECVQTIEEAIFRERFGQYDE